MADINQDDYTFERAPESDVIWIKHPETGGTAQLSLAALPYWAARGWEPCDPPNEADPTRAHMVEARRAAAAQATPDPAPDDAASTKKSGTAGTSSKGSD